VPFGDPDAPANLPAGWTVVGDNTSLQAI